MFIFFTYTKETEKTASIRALGSDDEETEKKNKEKMMEMRTGTPTLLKNIRSPTAHLQIHTVTIHTQSFL